MITIAILAISNISRETNAIENANLLELDRDHERIRYDENLFEMKNQIKEFNTIVETLADQITSIEKDSRVKYPYK